MRNILLSFVPACCGVLAALASAGSAQAQNPPPSAYAEIVANDVVLPPTPAGDQGTPYVSPLGDLYATLDFVGFARSGPTGSYARSNAYRDVLTGDNFDFGNQPGMRTLLGMRLTEVTAIEGSYLGLLEWGDRQAVKNLDLNGFGVSGRLFSPFTTFGFPETAGFDYNSLVTVANETQFNGAEINVRRYFEMPYPAFQVSGIGGFRFISVDDHFTYQSQSFVPTPNGTANFDDVAARNRMFGGQLGGMLELRVERRGWLNLEVKGLMLGNDAEQSTTFTTGPLVGAATTTAGEASQRIVTLGVDLQGSMAWKFTPSIVARLGYQVIYLDGLAMGADNFMKNAPYAATNPSLLDKEGQLTVHGPFMGVTATW